MARPRRLTVDQLTEARLAYEAGASGSELEQRYGLATNTAVRMLKSVGVQTRPAGKQPVEIAAPDLVLADWRAGMSCQAIAEKHGTTAWLIRRLLRSHGIDPSSRPHRLKKPGAILGRRAVSLQCYYRHKPILVIPIRTEAERRCRRWTQPERQAVEQAVAAGRVVYARRGLGLPHQTLRERLQAEWDAFHRAA